MKTTNNATKSTMGSKNAATATQAAKRHKTATNTLDAVEGKQGTKPCANNDSVKVYLHVSASTQVNLREYARITGMNLDLICWACLLNQADCLNDGAPYLTSAALREYHPPKDVMEIAVPQPIFRLLELASATLGVEASAFMDYLADSMDSGIEYEMELLRKLCNEGRVSDHTMDFGALAKDAAKYSMMVSKAPYRIFTEAAWEKGSYLDMAEVFTGKDKVQPK